MDSAFVQKAIEEIRQVADTRGIGAGEKVARRYVAESPDNPLLLAEWAELLLWTGETAESLKVASRAVALDRYCAPAHAALATHAAFSGNAEEAMRQYLHAFNLAPFAPETLLAGTNAYTVAGDAEEALVCARDFAAFLPDSTRAWSALHYALRAVGFHGEAEGQLENASDAIRHSGQFSIALARNYLMKSDALSAETAAREAVERSPESNGAWSTLSMALEFQGRYSEAVDAAAQALEINSHDTVALRIIQRVARDQGDVVRSAEFGQKAAQSAPFVSGDSEFYAVQDLIEEGEYEAALVGAFELEKTVSEVHTASLRGTILFLLQELGRWEELEQRLNRLGPLEEFDADCHAAAAALAQHRGDGDAALQILRIGLERFAESSLLRSQFLVTLGVNARAEELAAAAAEVLTLHIGNPSAYSELVDGLYEAGQVEAALELLRRGLDTFPDDGVLGLLAMSLMLDMGDFRAA
jgi:tetratricopeptide (TPR) repeat protein